MRYKHTLQSAALSLSLGLGLSLLSLPARAQTGDPVVVNGTNYTPTSGTTIETVTDGNSSSAVRVINGGALLGAEGWSLSTSGSSAYGVYLSNTSSFSGTNLNITATGLGAGGIFASSVNTVTLTGGTISLTGGSGGNGIGVLNNSSLTASGVSISTSGSSSYGLYVFNSTSSGTNLNITTTGAGAPAVYANGNATVHLTGGTLTTANATSLGVLIQNSSTAVLSNVEVNLAGNLVGISGTGVNTVTLDNVHGANGASVLNATGGTNTLSIQNSALKGNLVNNGATTSSTVNLVSGTLTGAASKLGSSTLNVSVDSASKWIVNASSTLSALTNQGVVDMRGGPKRMALTDFTQGAGATLAMTLSGTGGVANELVNVNGQLTLAGALVLNGNAGAAVLDATVGGYFVLFNTNGNGVSGEFSSLQLNGASYSAADGSTFTDANGYTYTLTYQGDAATGALTGGNDVLLHVVPEPGTWAMLVGGFGLLFCGQRLRRRARG